MRKNSKPAPVRALALALLLALGVPGSLATDCRMARPFVPLSPTALDAVAATEHAGHAGPASDRPDRSAPDDAPGCRMILTCGTPASTGAAPVLVVLAPVAFAEPRNRAARPAEVPHTQPTPPPRA